MFHKTNKAVRMFAVSLLMVSLGALMLPATASAFDFTVTPLIIEFDDTEAFPGDTLMSSIQITNQADNAEFFGPEVADFYYNEEGTMVFFESDETPYPDNSLKNWITVETDVFRLEPKETRTIDFTMAIPEDAKAGGHYGVIFFRSQADPEAIGGTGVATAGRLGTLVLVTIPGELEKTAEVNSFKVGTADEKGNLIPQDKFEVPPVSFSFELVNTGNTYFEPTGSIYVKGFNVEKNVELAQLKAFPNIPKTFIQTLEADKFMFGKYTATLKVKDGDGNLLPEKTVNFTVYAWNLIIFWGVIVLVVLVILIGAISKFSSSSKGKKKKK